MKDLSMENPEYLDVRNLHKGVQTKENIEPHKQGKNCHCNDKFAKLVSKKSPTRKIHTERKKRIPAKKIVVDKLKIRCRNS